MSDTPVPSKELLIQRNLLQVQMQCLQVQIQVLEKRLALQGHEVSKVEDREADLLRRRLMELPD